MRTLLVGLILGALVGCATAPYTGRSQLILVSAQEEAAMGAAAYKEVLEKSRIERGVKVNRLVDQVGERIARAADRADFEWTFTVIDDAKQANAFALPGGKVAVYTGIFPVAETTTGLAVVVAHEIAHVLARHGAERVSQSLATQAGAVAVGMATGSQAIMQAYGLGAELGVLLPWGRTQESEADRIGLILMAQAGYDPREAIAFWQRMEQNGDRRQPPEFLSTHPNHETRQQQIESWLAEALPYYEGTTPAPVEKLPAP
jgi:metalloendopeptidase OMA1, mitochondrial